MTSASVFIGALAGRRLKYAGRAFEPLFATKPDLVAHAVALRKVAADFPNDAELQLLAAIQAVGVGDVALFLERRQFVDETVARIQRQVGEAGRVVCGLSGGVDSTVAALLVHKAIGNRLTCIFVDNGLLRQDEAKQVRTRFERLHLPLDFVDATELFLGRLSGVTDPETKRKVIGAAFIDVFEQRANELGGFDFLAQGTLYPDVIESVSVVGPSAAINPSPARIASSTSSATGRFASTRRPRCGVVREVTGGVGA